MSEAEENQEALFSLDLVVLQSAGLQAGQTR